MHVMFGCCWKRICRTSADLAGCWEYGAKGSNSGHDLPVGAGKRHPVQTRIRRPGLHPRRVWRLESRFLLRSGIERRPHARALSAARLLAHGKPPCGAELHARTPSAARLLACCKPARCARAFPGRRSWPVFCTSLCMGLWGHGSAKPALSFARADGLIDRAIY